MTDCIKYEDNNENPNEIELSIKIIIIGDSSVGKTSILLKYVEKLFPEEHISTIGVEYKEKIIKRDCFNIKFKVYYIQQHPFFGTLDFLVLILKSLFCFLKYISFISNLLLFLNNSSINKSKHSLILMSSLALVSKTAILYFSPISAKSFLKMTLLSSKSHLFPKITPLISLSIFSVSFIQCFTFLKLSKFVIS